MVGKIVLTYKRKRLCSSRDNPDAPEFLESKLSYTSERKLSVDKNAVSTSAEDRSSTSPRRFGNSSLLKFCRRSKRKLDEVELGTSIKPAVVSYMENHKLVFEQETRKGPDQPHCSPASEQATATVLQRDDRFFSSHEDPVTSLNLSISSSPVCRDIDCNRPLDFDSDEKQNVSLEENRPKNSFSSKTTCNGDKGKCAMDLHSTSTGNFARNGYLELFPVNRSVEKVDESARRLYPKPPFVRSFPVQPEHIFPPVVDASCCWPPSGFHPFRHPFSGHPDDAYRAMDQNRTIISVGKFSSQTQTLWLDEELDSLWIGVRRHGQGNFDAILHDPRLHFLSWKTPRDLAGKWREEQHKLLYGTQIPEKVVKSSGYGFSAVDQLPVGIPGKFSSFSTQRYPIGGSDGSSLPHWLREAAARKQIPPWNQFGTTYSSEPSSRNGGGCRYGSSGMKDQQHGVDPSFLHSSESGAGRRLRNRRPAPDEWVVNDRDDAETIVRSGGASSEGTISDDHSIRT
ncbi:hypothetical protein M569_10350 [Genlisea aurea]|uniref:Myb-like domain-containing protein n=1 Tax=Genlisea aurea TaxID=192259 RepID=S8CIF2_9LAMI|nr:hypothetical protein M569_10350 [Genlisea aurea]